MDELIDLLDAHVAATGAVARPLRAFTSPARWTRDAAVAALKTRTLPDLDDATTAEIVPANVDALAALYLAAELEQLKLFAVADRVAQSFVDGTLPVHRPAADPLYQYWKSAHQRMTEAERADVYARAFGRGALTSPPPPPPNVDFTPLWHRFLAAVETRAGGDDGGAATRTAARALARNLSRHGGGTMHGAATELQRLARDVLSMLSAPSLLAAYGVRDAWQLVERVSALYLGGAPDGAAQRTRAQRGATIIQWLADHAPLLGGEPSALDPRADLALRSAVEAWLAAAAVP